MPQQHSWIQIKGTAAATRIRLKALTKLVFRDGVNRQTSTELIFETALRCLVKRMNFRSIGSDNLRNQATSLLLMVQNWRFG